MCELHTRNFCVLVVNKELEMIVLCYIMSYNNILHCIALPYILHCVGTCRVVFVQVM